MKRIAKILSIFVVIAIVFLGCIRFWNDEAFHVVISGLRWAAEHNNVWAQDQLAYANAIGIPHRSSNGYTRVRDISEAVKWWTMAANNGDATAQYSLGVVYVKGEGGWPKNYEKAYQWFYKASQNGYPSALTAVHNLEAVMTPDQLTEAKRMTQ